MNYIAVIFDLYLLKQRRIQILKNSGGSVKTEVRNHKLEVKGYTVKQKR